MMAAALEQSWVEVKEVAHLFGMSWESAKNSIAKQTFPVLTYKLGKRRVVDVDVLAKFFEDHKRNGMKALGHK